MGCQDPEGEWLLDARDLQSDAEKITAANSSKAVWSSIELPQVEEGKSESWLFRTIASISVRYPGARSVMPRLGHFLASDHHMVQVVMCRPGTTCYV